MNRENVTPRLRVFIFHIGATKVVVPVVASSPLCRRAQFSPHACAGDSFNPCSALLYQLFFWATGSARDPIALLLLRTYSSLVVMYVFMYIYLSSVVCMCFAAACTSKRSVVVRDLSGTNMGKLASLCRDHEKKM